MTSGSHRNSIAILLLIALTAIASSTLRFGQRENEHLPESDSDYYIDMAQVFAEQKLVFEEEFVTPYPHHYSRPTLPFLAGVLDQAVPWLSLRACFSILNIVAGAILAWMLYVVIRRSRPELHYAWAGPLLFLTGFPQMNWGYHILTDTIGLATAFGAALMAAHILDEAELSCRQRACSFFGVGRSVSKFARRRFNIRAGCVSERRLRGEECRDQEKTCKQPGPATRS